MKVRQMSAAKTLVDGIFCTDVQEGLDQAIARGDRFNAVIADPPYNIGKDFGNNEDRLELKEYTDWTHEWLGKCMKLLDEGGLLYMYGLAEIMAHIAVGLPMGNQRWLAWHYTNKAVPRSRFWQRSHESILCLWNGPRPKLCIDQIREPYNSPYLNCAGRTRKNTHGRFESSSRESVYGVHPNGALPRDVIKVAALAGGAGASERWFKCETCGDVYRPGELKNHRTHATWKHPTQKPMELTRRLLSSAIDLGSGGRVLIPFVGSGSECVVARSLNCSFLGFEINSDYVDLANAWLDSGDGSNTA